MVIAVPASGGSAVFAPSTGASAGLAASLPVQRRPPGASPDVEAARTQNVPSRSLSPSTVAPPPRSVMRVPGGVSTWGGFNSLARTASATSLQGSASAVASAGPALPTSSRSLPTPLCSASPTAAPAVPAIRQVAVRDVAAAASCSFASVPVSTVPAVDPLAWRRAVAAAADSMFADGVALDMMSAMVSHLDDADELVRIWAADVIAEVATRIRGRGSARSWSQASQSAAGSEAMVGSRRMTPSTSTTSLVGPVIAPGTAASSTLQPRLSTAAPAMVANRRSLVTRMPSAPASSLPTPFSAPSSMVAPASSRARVMSNTEDVWRLPLPQPAVAMQPSRSSSCVVRTIADETGQAEDAVQASLRRTHGEAEDSAQASLRRVHAEVSNVSIAVSALAVKMESMVQDAAGSKAILECPVLLRGMIENLSTQEEAVARMRSVLDHLPGKLEPPFPHAEVSEVLESCSQEEMLRKQNEELRHGIKKAIQTEANTSKTLEILTSEADLQLVTPSRASEGGSAAPSRGSEGGSVAYHVDMVSIPLSDVTVSPMLEDDDTMLLEASPSPSPHRVVPRRSSRSHLGSSPRRTTGSPVRQAVTLRKRSSEGGERSTPNGSENVALTQSMGTWKLAGEWIPPGRSAKVKRKPTRMQSSYF